MNKETHILQQRWHDRQWNAWTDWGDVDEESYGTTLEEWKKSCQNWLNVGGTYEYRIVKRTDVLEWELSYLNYKQPYEIR